jgi:hypothetical protein
MKFALALTLAAVALTGCIANMTPIGSTDVARLHSDLRACARETFAFTLIPDFGITADNHRRKCIEQRGWVTAGRNTWAWIRDDAWKRELLGTPPEAAPEPTWATGF